MIKRLILLLIAAAAAIAVYSTLPTRTQTLASTAPQPVRGAIHVHTRRSDGTGTVDDIAAAAARAGLQFVIITDHGDAYREPERPVYRQGVLFVDAVEISTTAGHLVALGLPRAPYPLGGEPRDVVEDVVRLGGMAIAAHPGSSKPDLRWSDWETPIDGLEWLNGDSEWRDEKARTLVQALFTYPFRSSETLAMLLDRDSQVFARWDALTRSRRVVALAAPDAHGGIRLHGTDPYVQAATLPVPSYEQIFRTFSIALATAQLRGDAAADSRTVIDEIRRGHVYSSIDAIARPASMIFTAASGAATAQAGDTLMPSGPVSLTVETNAPPGAMLTLVQDGHPIMSAGPPSLHYSAAVPAAVYRVEVFLDRGPGNPAVPWLVSNPIYVGPQQPAAPSSTRAIAPREALPIYTNGEPRGWSIETSADSRGAIDTARAPDGTQVRFRYALGGVEQSNAYSALVLPVGEGLQRFDRVMFSIRADKPTRVSVQARAPDSAGLNRWQRSIYADAEARTVTVFFDDMVPVGPNMPRHPPLAEVGTVLFVIDTVNTRLGTNGQVLIDDVKYAR